MSEEPLEWAAREDEHRPSLPRHLAALVVDDRLTVLRRALHRYIDIPAVRDVEDRSRALLRSG